MISPIIGDDYNDWLKTISLIIFCWTSPIEKMIAPKVGSFLI